MPTAYQPIRINRTVQNSAFELMDPMYMEGTWADNIRYSISIAHKAVALGTTIPLEIQLTPLNKKLQIKQINNSMGIAKLRNGLRRWKTRKIAANLYIE
ncbi:putative HECT-type ubiquitin ligase-interacting protein creD [Colletotrichum sp. SAR11_240]|nr:putative HECT-type ubiquitin ligase-interacting protein creD [Colletotrichum sp. SAR11_240]